MKAFERRMAASVLEVRDNADGVTLTGYASTFNDPYDMGWYTETVDPGAFKRTLGQKPDVRLLINHDGLPLARTTSGTLTLDTDSRGLRVSTVLDPTDPDVAALVPKMRRGDLNQMSFGFRTIEDAWSDNMSKRTMRSLVFNDGDVSVVTYPANPNASAAIRSAGTAVDAVTSALRHLEQRAASTDDVVAVLQRALGYFSSVDTIVDSAQAELAAALGVPNPDDAQDAVMDGDRASKQPYGDVPYADPGYQSDGKKRYPIDTEAHAKAAWSYINQGDNASAYTANQLASIKSRIKAALKKFGVEVSDEQKSAAVIPERRLFAALH
jgi:HK97 family phage prohead protease